MRYNSLRSQLNWHSRQQTHIFKKIAKNTNDKQLPTHNQNQIQQEHHLKGHQLIWLEKMMKDLHQYKEEAVDQQPKSKKAKDDPADAILREKCGNHYKQTKPMVEKQKRPVVNLEENGKSAKKIKFQIVINQDKSQSIKKACLSQQKPKNKSSKKMPSKTVPKKTVPQKYSGSKQNVSKEVIRQVNNSCPSNTKVIQVEDIKTDPYSFKEADIQILQQLWKKQSEQANEPQPKLSSKKSVGKIIKNSQKLNKTCIQMTNKQAKQIGEPQPHGSSCQAASSQSNQNSSYKQYKQSKHKQSTSIHSFQSKELMPFEVKQAISNQFKTQPSVEKPKEKDIKIIHRPQDIKIIHRPQDIAIPQKKLKYQKIYIKLQTQKLSQYLCQKSQVKITQDPNDKIIQTNQYEKYCVTKRAERPAPNFNIAANQLQESQKKNYTHQKKIIQSLNDTNNKQQNGPKTKSEQRKLNKFAQNIRPTKLFDIQAYPKEPKQYEKVLQKSIVAPRINLDLKQKLGDSGVEIKLKRKYDYSQQLPSKGQKLFTLHSVSSDYSSKQQQQQIQQQKKQQNQSIKYKEQSIRPSLSIQFEQQQQWRPSSQIVEHQYCQTVPSNQQTNQPSQNNLSQSVFKQSVVVKDTQVAKSDLTQELTLLFKFLDEGHRGLLTDTNCLYQSLTQELKLLFSVILNQIRTKKRFYNLQKFIQQSKEILQIKNQVYNSNHKTSENQNMVYQILKENLDILKKKLPLMFVKCTYTQSCFDNSNMQSRKNSLSYGQSFVVDKIELDRNTIRRQIQDCMHSNHSQSTPSVNKQPSNFSSKNDFDIKWTEKRQKDKENLQRCEQSFRKYSKKADENKASQLDLLQPQIYLQKKYGFSNREQEQVSQNTSKMNNILVKTRGYLQNLDNYIKMR